jgi:hypothetical protein
VRGQENAHPCGWKGVYRPIWWSITVLLGTAGIAGGVLVLGPGGTLVLAAGSATLATLGVWQFGPQHGAGGPGRNAAALGTACALGLLALIGLSCEVGLASFACGVLVGAAGWPLRRHRSSAAGPSRERTGPAHSPGPPLEVVPADPLPPAAGLRALSTPELCRTWRVSYVCLGRFPCPSYLESLAELRRGCLDELERRDPVAFGRWFPTARAASDPARYFCRESQR